MKERHQEEKAEVSEETETSHKAPYLDENKAYLISPNGLLEDQKKVAIAHYIESREEGENYDKREVVASEGRQRSVVVSNVHTRIYSL